MFPLLTPLLCTVALRKYVAVIQRYIEKDRPCFVCLRGVSSTKLHNPTEKTKDLAMKSLVHSGKNLILYCLLDKVVPVLVTNAALAQLVRAAVL